MALLCRFNIIKNVINNKLKINTLSSLSKLSLSSLSCNKITKSYFSSSSTEISSKSIGHWKPPPRGIPGKDGYEEMSKIRNVAIIAHVDHVNLFIIVYYYLGKNNIS